ncbi:MAG: 4'-phosphopantetheinyl transferase superfamily protein [Ruminococcus sp.]|nr:4'-phosphopantetheinyl transferase superfamily protein [Ruminococcus sp.]
MKIFYAHIDDFSTDFYCDAVSVIPLEKAEALKKITHIETAHESILAWVMVTSAYKTEHGLDSALPKLEFYENGKPRFEKSNFHFNISHSGGLVCVATSKSEIGIDVQKIQPGSDAVKRRVLSKNELRIVNESANRDEVFIDIWSRKESYLKFTGLGISQELRRIDFSLFLSESDFIYNSLRYRCMTIQNCKLTVCSHDSEIELCKFCEEMQKRMINNEKS